MISISKECKKMFLCPENKNKKSKKVNPELAQKIIEDIREEFIPKEKRTHETKLIHLILHLLLVYFINHNH